MNNVEFGQELRGTFAELSQYFPGLQEVITQTMFALVTREHTHWRGGPGRSKSRLAMTIFDLFDFTDSSIDAQPRFDLGLTKDMLSSSLFGEEIAKEAFESGRIVRNFDGGLCDCVFFFGDEFMDAPDWLLRTMLAALNERRYVSKDQTINPIPLHTAITATNHNRRNQLTEAVYDRLVCQAEFPAISGVVDQLVMFDGYLSFSGQQPPLPKLRYDDLLDFSNVVESSIEIMVPQEVRLLQGFLISRYAEQRIQREKEKLATKSGRDFHDIEDAEVDLEEVTPRRMNKTFDFTRASALLQGRKEAVVQDVMAIKYGLIVANSHNGDEGTWEQVCSTYIPTTKAQLGRLRDLAEIAEEIGAVKHSPATKRQRVPTRFRDFRLSSAIEWQNLVDNVAGRGNSPLLKEIGEELKAEVRRLGQAPNPTDFPLFGSWPKKLS